MSTYYPPRSSRDRYEVQSQASRYISTEEELSEAKERLGPMRKTGNVTLSASMPKENGPRTSGKMERGISKAGENEYLIMQARNQVESHFQRMSPDSPGSGTTSPSGGSSAGVSSTSSGPSFPLPHQVGNVVTDGPRGTFIDTPIYTFTLPDFSIYQDEFRGFLEKELIELSSLISLENSGRLNWWAETGTSQRLWPLSTTGDGNCLLHAASLGMWGFHDRLLTLRKALHEFLTSKQSAIYRRWRWQSHLMNMQFGLQLSEKEWEEEWKSVLRLASSEPRHSSSSSAMSTSSTSSNSSTNSSSSASSSSKASSSKPPPASQRRWSRFSLALGAHEQLEDSGGAQSPTMMYESLEEIHVLALAHILRRPIIVVADTVLKDMNGEALAPIPFGGVYLPLECDPDDCQKSPLLLTYNAGHFSALVSMQQANEREDNCIPAVIPLTDSSHILLPLHFATDPGQDFDWSMASSPDILQTSSIHLHPTTHINLLSQYLDVVKVALPEWLLSIDPYEQEATLNQIQAKKQPLLGSLGRKIKKNIGKLARSSSLSRTCGKDARQNTRIQPTIVETTQSFILSAMIKTGRPLPYQTEMIENYLQEAKRRFETDREVKQKLKEEQLELQEKQKREIYLNGGYTDCVNPGCSAQGTADTNYLCKPCYTEQTSHHQRNLSNGSSSIFRHGNSKFYVQQPDHHHPNHVYDVDHAVAESGSRSYNIFEADGQTVRKSDSERPVYTVQVTKPCRSVNCDFFGTRDTDYFCSKCYSKMKPER